MRERFSDRDSCHQYRTVKFGGESRNRITKCVSRASDFGSKLSIFARHMRGGAKLNS